MTQHVLCDYSLARMRLTELTADEVNYLSQFCADNDISGEFLFLVLPEAAMPVISDSNSELTYTSASDELDAMAITADLCIAVNCQSNSMSWVLQDNIDGKPLLFQIGSDDQPLAPAIVQQMDEHGFIFVIFINSRSGAPKGMRVFKK